MAGSVSNIRTFIETWNLDELVDERSEYIPNGCILLAWQANQKKIGEARKILEARLGRLINTNLFKSHCDKLIKQLAKVIIILFESCPIFF